MQIQIYCVPPRSTYQANQRIHINHATGKRHIGQSAKGRELKAELSRLFRPSRPDSPLSGPLELDLTLVYPYRKAEAKSNLGKFIPKPTRPDCDNLAKAIQDVMGEDGFFNDDGQIVHLFIAKYWGPTTGIFGHLSLLPCGGVLRHMRGINYE